MEINGLPYSPELGLARPGLLRGKCGFYMRKEAIAIVLDVNSSLVFAASFRVAGSTNRITSKRSQSYLAEIFVLCEFARIIAIDRTPPLSSNA
ncbi:MAG: hypothetical protein LBU32_32090 [Clostridiales bacterium]|nr:hypothetical protein [Clostridiales bacterium]